MSIFTILVIIFIVVPIIKKVFDYFNEQKSLPASYNWANLHSSRLRSILSTYENFQDEEIIDSTVGFYLFSYNDDTKELIFIQEEGVAVIHHFTYQQLISYNIRNTQDYGIFIDLKTTIPNKSYISIECFNRDTVLKRVPYLTPNPSEIDNLYQIEEEKIKEIEHILHEIVEEQTNTELPPVFQEETIAVPKKIIIKHPSFTTPPPEDRAQVMEVMEEPIPVEIEECLPSFEELTLNEVPEIQEPSIDVPEELTDSHTDDDKVQVSLSDIDNYSYGKFLDWEIQSAVGDAKIKGRKFIYISSEQLDKLKS